MKLRVLSAVALVAAVVALGAFSVHFAPMFHDPSRITELGARAFAGKDRQARWELDLLAFAGSAEAKRMMGEAILDGATGQPREQGLQPLRSGAESGDRACARELGKALLYGRGGVRVDAAEAVRWLTRAAEAGDAAAAYHLGLHYRAAGEDHAPADSVKWLELAAKQNLPQAMFQLANAYRYGEGAAVDEHKALDLYNGAAEHENPESIQVLAMAYQNGELGLTRDPEMTSELLLELQHAIKDPVVRP